MWVSAFLILEDPIRVSLDGGGRDAAVPYFSSRCMSASNITQGPVIVSKKVKTGSKQPSQKKMPHKV